jgi:hypothetical protein
MPETFISEAIEPVGASFATQPLVAGEPAFPQEFSWRGHRYEVAEVSEKWKESGNCTHGAGEKYLRKHWYRIRTTDDTRMKIYFERKARGTVKIRWFVYSVNEPGTPRNLSP